MGASSIRDSLRIRVAVAGRLVGDLPITSRMGLTRDSPQDHARRSMASSVEPLVDLVGLSRRPRVERRRYRSGCRLPTSTRA